MISFSIDHLRTLPPAWEALAARFGEVDGDVVLFTAPQHTAWEEACRSMTVIPLRALKLRDALHPGLYDAVVQEGEMLADQVMIRADRLRELAAGSGIRGLGDVVALVAIPVALASDRLLGTALADCGDCRRRRDTLNAVVPIG